MDNCLAVRGKSNFSLFRAKAAARPLAAVLAICCLQPSSFLVPRKVYDGCLFAFELGAASSFPVYSFVDDGLNADAVRLC